ncbi:MAG: hypothetical protein Q7R52_02870 [archaeon]|nr:hypothetical protein [archaeon]
MGFGNSYINKHIVPISGQLSCGKKYKMQYVCLKCKNRFVDFDIRKIPICSCCQCNI